jgi:adenine phosphoribosyltransferase
MPALSLADRLRAAIRDVPDFPREGILFKDVTTLLGDAEAFRAAIDGLVGAHAGQSIDLVVGIEARGFILGGAVAYALGAGFVPVRKPGKLPAERTSVSYTLEYGENVLEIYTDAIRSGQRVLVVDDLLATGGTAAATVELVQRLGGVIVGVAFLVELAFLEGARALGDLPRVSLVHF